MLTRDNTGLRIFDGFVIDRTLPKYKEKEQNEETTAEDSGNFVFGGSSDADPERREGNELIDYLTYLNEVNPSIWVKIKLLLAKLIFKHSKKQQQKMADPQKFFDHVKTSFSYLESSKEVEDYYIKNIEQAQQLGQTALVEKLVNQKEVILNECRLKENKINKFVTEQQVIDFYNQVGRPKNLKLSWVKNFTRIIPSEAVKLKEKADELRIFDNYVILHYDPEGEGVSETEEEEKERKKDPILFGVMQNSRKLYFVADWVDEYCDLTLEKMMNELGDEANKINNKTIKSYIGT